MLGGEMEEKKLNKEELTEFMNIMSPIMLRCLTQQAKKATILSSHPTLEEQEKMSKYMDTSGQWMRQVLGKSMAIISHSVGDMPQHFGVSHPEITAEHILRMNKSNFCSGGIEVSDEVKQYLTATLQLLKEQ